MRWTRPPRPDSRTWWLAGTVAAVVLGSTLAIPLGAGRGSPVAGGAGPASTHASGPAPTAEPPRTAPAEPAAVATQGPPGDPAHWVQVFGDEFTGTRLDTSKWQSNRYGGRTNDGTFNPKSEWGFFSPRNVAVRNGNAVLEVRPQALTLDGVTYAYSTGVITTEHRFLARDGDYVEARIRIPRGAGLFPAFWTIPAGTAPPETDIAEFYDTQTYSRPTGVYHPADGGNPHIDYGDPATDYRDSWHTYGMLRAGGRIVFYLDGVPYPLPVTGVDSLPQYLLLNLSVYRGATPPPGTQMLVDWVRVWRPAPGSCAALACSPAP